MKHKARLTAKILALTAIFLLVQGPTTAQATVQMAQDPYWSVGVSNQYPTGIGWGDFDNNGWLDLSVTRGLDVVKLPNRIYFNWGGQVDTAPGWTSDDLEAGDNVSIGDLDNDGDLDLLVSHLGITATGMDPLPAVAYYNSGTTLSTSPGWYSQPANSFSSALGDPDGDGDLDVAVGQGDWATGHGQRQAIYRNNGGILDTMPCWQSDSTYYVDEITFIDVDNDGDLDLATGHERGGVRIFYNNSGVIETTPSWALGTVTGARQMDFGDIDENGYPDLVIASPVKGYYLFLNRGGVLDTLPSWSNLDNTQPCCVDLADIDGDGDLDLAAGAWSSPLVVYQNNGGAFGSSPSWSYSNGSRVEQVCWGDADGDGTADTVEYYPGDGSGKLFYLSKTPLCRVNSVSVDGIPLLLTDYCYHLADSWVSLKDPVGVGSTLAVSYRYSDDLDLTTAHGAVLIFKNKSNILVAVTPENRVIAAGESTSFTVTLQRQYGSYGPVEPATEISPVPAPGSVEVSFSSDTVSANDTLTLNVHTTGAAIPGSYSITIALPVGADTIRETVTLEILGSAQAAVIGGDHAMMELVRGLWGTVDSLWSVPPVIGPSYQALVLEHGAVPSDTATIRQFIEGGGRVLLTRQTPLELCGSTSITPISGWIGAGGYANYSGPGLTIISTFGQPFGVTGINSDDTLGTAVSGFGRLSGLGANGVRVARLGTSNAILAGVYCPSGSGHCFYYTGGMGISSKSDSLIRGFLIHPVLGVCAEDNRENGQIQSFKLEAWPNPHREKTTIRYSVVSRIEVELGIYDILGRLVRVVDEGMREAGTYAVEWNGKNSTGQNLSAGIYFIRLNYANGSKTRKIVKLQ